MRFRRDREQFNPLEHSAPLTEEQMIDFGVEDYTMPKAIKTIDGISIVKNRFKMRDGWDYKVASTVLPPERMVTPVSMNMTGGWFTDYDDGFNLRREVAIAKLGMEGSSISVPLNSDRGWGDLEANAYNQARISRAMAAILGRQSLKNPDGTPQGRHLDLFTVDGLSRGAMHGEAVTGISPEVGSDVLFAYYTVACRINGVEEVEDIKNILQHLTPKNLAQIAMRGEIPDELMLAHIVKKGVRAGKAIGEALGNEFTPIRELISTPINKMRQGASLNEAIGDSIGKFHPNSIVVPYQILRHYPNSLDLKHIHRQILEAYTLTNGTYGDLAQKVSPDQFQVHSGFTKDGLSHFEEIMAWHKPATHPHTIIEGIEGGTHITSVIEEKNREWKNRWATVIQVLGEVGIKELENMTPSERSSELHRRSAAKNPFFADENNPHHPAPDSPHASHELRTEAA